MGPWFYKVTPYSSLVAIKFTTLHRQESGNLERESDSVCAGVQQILIISNSKHLSFLIAGNRMIIRRDHIAESMNNARYVQNRIDFASS